MGGEVNYSIFYEKTGLPYKFGELNCCHLSRLKITTFSQGYVWVMIAPNPASLQMIHTKHGHDGDNDYDGEDYCGDTTPR